MSQQKSEEMSAVERLPVTPDPFWPPGVPPRHLSVVKQNDPEIVSAFTGIVGEVWHCEKCNTTVDRSGDSKYCRKCILTEAQNYAVAKKTNSNWMEEAEKLGLAPYEHQPEETDLEWFVWTKYREYYPHKMPTWNELAKACNCNIRTVVHIAQKWSFKVRLMAWARATDASIQEKRIEAIKVMNEKQLGMAQTIQEKLKTAIDLIDPALLRPSEIVNLFKVATELERKVTTYVEEKVADETAEARAKQLSLTKPEDLSEVVAILQKTGLLEGKTLGIEQTTRIIAKETE